MRRVMVRAGFMLVLALALTALALPAVAEEPEDDAGTDPLGIQDIVSAIVAVFIGADAEQVSALHDAGVGFGEIFKLQAMAAVTGGDLLDLITQLTGEDGELELGWGAWRHSLTLEQLATLEQLPKNLGQVVAAAHRSENALGGNGPGQGNGGGNGHGHDGGEGDGD